jgi:hypothetical protein
LILDVAQPFRKDALGRVGRLVTRPPFLGRDEALSKLDVPLGCVGLVRAAPGAGGTRLLEEAERRMRPSHALRIGPSFAPREPLGALRNALARASSAEGAPVLPERLYEVLDRLLGGDGLEPAAAAELLDAWLQPAEGRSGVLVIDDAGAVDTATLEAVAGAMLPQGFFRALVRVGEDEPIPAPIAGMPVAAEVKLGPLPKEDAEAFARALCGGAITDEAARRWARLGKGMPLGIREAMAEALSTGDLRWTGEKAEPRAKSSGRGRPVDVAGWIAQRMGFLSPGQRAALIGLALLGGDAPAQLIDAVATLMEGPGARVAVVEESLIAQGWVVRPEEGWLALVSRSAGKAILGALDEGQRATWFRMSGRMLERNVGALGLAEVAHQAAEGGERGSAAQLAAEAARAAAKVLQWSSSAQLVAQARAWDPAVEVPELPDLQGPREEAPIESLALSSVIGRHAARPQTVAEAMEALGEDPEAAADPDVLAARITDLMKRALVEGDVETLEHLVVRLRVTGEYDALVERMSAFVALGRGAPGDALRKLRAAAEAAQSPRQRARARLSYGVALASVGHTDRALLEALDALARAREAKDARGEQACARFLAYLSAAAGQPRAASIWGKVARRAVDPASH